VLAAFDDHLTPQPIRFAFLCRILQGPAQSSDDRGHVARTDIVSVRYIQYFRDLGQLPLDHQGMLNPADIARTMARYATDVVHPS